MVLQWQEDESDVDVAFEDDVARWFTVGLAPDEAAAADGLPEELLRQLWPDISRFGPNGQRVVRLQKDLMASRKNLREETEFRVYRLVENLDDNPSLRFLNLDDFTAVDGDLQDNLETLASRFFGLFNKLAFVVLTVTAVDGFIDPENATEKELGIRGIYLPLYNKLLSFIELNGEDYLSPELNARAEKGLNS